MKILKKLLLLMMAAMLCVSCAGAEEYVSVGELRQQAQASIDEGWVLIPDVEQVAVLTIKADALAQENPLLVKVGEFDEVASGKFVRCVRYGRTPSHTELTNGLILENAQAILDEELNRLVGRSIDDYGLIWTEIAEWKNMETWLLYYGQRFGGLTCFNTGLTVDARTPEYHYMVIPHYEQADMIYADVPLAPWSTIKASVDAFLTTRKSAQVDVLELGYWMQEGSGLLQPVWRLAYTAANGYKEIYFCAQTGAEMKAEQDWKLPEAFGWEAVR